MSKGDLLRKTRVAILALFASALPTLALAQTAARPAPPRDKQVHLKHILVIGQTKGWEHDSVSDGMVALGEGGAGIVRFSNWSERSKRGLAR